MRKYGCDLTFTPMIVADSFVKSQKARDVEFGTNKCKFSQKMKIAIEMFVNIQGLLLARCTCVICNTKWQTCVNKN